MLKHRLLSETSERNMQQFRQKVRHRCSSVIQHTTLRRGRGNIRQRHSPITSRPRCKQAQITISFKTVPLCTGCTHHNSLCTDPLHKHLFMATTAPYADGTDQQQIFAVPWSHKHKFGPFYFIFISTCFLAESNTMQALSPRVLKGHITCLPYIHD